MDKGELNLLIPIFNSRILEKVKGWSENGKIGDFLGKWSEITREDNYDNKRN